MPGMMFTHAASRSETRDLAIRKPSSLFGTVTKTTSSPMLFLYAASRAALWQAARGLSFLQPLPFVDDPGPSGKCNYIVVPPVHPQSSAGRLHEDIAAGKSIQSGCDCRCGRSRSGRKRKPDASFPKSNLDLLFGYDSRKFDIRPIREERVIFKQAAGLTQIKVLRLVQEKSAMRITH